MLCFDLVYAEKKNEINEQIIEACKNNDYEKVKELREKLRLLEVTHQFPKYMA